LPKNNPINRAEMTKSIDVLGIDASLTGTGLAIIAGDEVHTMRLDNNLRGVARLVYIREYIKRYVTKAKLAVIEGYAFARAKQAHQIGELGGVLRVMVNEAGTQLLEVPPTCVKKFATGQGNATKEKVAVGVYKHWGKEFKTNDEADAFVLAQIGKAYLEGWDGLTSYQVEVMTTLTKESEAV
jgi:crossover junction endodeoxyribonuclease RuvC